MKHPRSGRRLMIVDDEAQMTKLLKSILEDEMQAQVEIFNNPLEAFKRLQSQDFDAISLDHRMPQMTGMALLELLRKSEGPNQHTPVVVFTAFSEEVRDLGVEAMEHVLLLEKPIAEEKYLRNIQFAVEMKSLSQKKRKQAA